MIDVEPYLQKLEWLKVYMNLKINDGMPKNLIIKTGRGGRMTMFDLFPSFEDFMLYIDFVYAPIDIDISKP